tara:strand:+ start:583 stop:774 length:192 start_codon:yes stop_codon:yes gene_type:complete
MKTIIRLIDFLLECLNTDHRKRGMACFICTTIVLVALIGGLLYTINNFIDKPINTNTQIEKAK